MDPVTSFADPVLGLAVGVGLSAACGFRVFLPALGASIAAWTGHLEFAPGFEWLGSPMAIVALAAASTLEVGTYFVPWLDNLADAAATPAAVTAGTLLTASMVGDTSPFLQWSLALIAGGGVAGAVQGGTVLARGASSASTAGLGNPIVAVLELAGSAITTVLALVAPLIVVLLIPVFLFAAFRAWRRRKGKRHAIARERPPRSVPPE